VEGENMTMKRMDKCRLRKEEDGEIKAETGGRLS